VLCVCDSNGYEIVVCTLYLLCCKGHLCCVCDSNGYEFVVCTLYLLCFKGHLCCVGMMAMDMSL
jgi:hypothetical protein